MECNPLGKRGVLRILHRQGINESTKSRCHIECFVVLCNNNIFNTSINEIFTFEE